MRTSRTGSGRFDSFEFGGVDVFVERRASEEAIRTAVSTLTGHPSECIALIQDIEELLSQGHRAVVCQVFPISGNFEQRVSINTERVNLSLPGWPEVATLLAGLLRCRCAVPDESINPFTYYLASPDGSVEWRGIIAQPTDEDCYVLGRHEPDLNDLILLLDGIGLAAVPFVDCLRVYDQEEARGVDGSSGSMIEANRMLSIALHPAGFEIAQVGGGATRRMSGVPELLRSVTRYFGHGVP